VGIGLVTDVPDDAIIGSIEDIMQRDGKLDHSEAGAKMTAGHSHSVNGFLAEFVGNLAELVGFQASEVFGCLDEVEQRGFRNTSHSMLLN
jgi:hypothetical protein